MRSVVSRTLVFVTALIFGHVPLAVGQVTLTFPSTDSITGGPTGNGPLGTGGSSDDHYMLGDDLTKSFTSTGIVSAENSRWVFAMTDWTSIGVVSTFNVQINGVTVGNFNLVGIGSQKTNNFDLTFNHAAPLAGQNYTLRMVATSTVPVSDGWWNWDAGGSVTLNGIEVASYWDVNGTTPGSGVTSGGVYNWNSASWSTNSVGSAATSSFTSGQKAIFSAGSDGAGPFTVNVNASHNVSGISFQEGGVTLAAASGTLTLVAPTIDVQTAGATATIAAPLTGSVGLTKSGPGKLILSGTTNYTGGTTVGQGTLQLGDGLTGAITLAGSITLGNATTGAGDVALLVNRSGGGATSLSNAITVSSLGTGTVTIGSNLSSQSGATTFTGPLTLNRATTMTGNNADRTTYTGTISGAVGTLTVTGGARTTWQGNNTFVGNVVVTGAGTVLQVGAGTNPTFSRIPDAANVHVDAGTTLRLQNNSEVIDALTGSGTVNNITAVANTLTVGAGGDSGLFSGLLENGESTLSLIKTGGGTQTLAALNTYSGMTTINGGALRITHGQALGNTTGATTVASGGRLELSGGITTVAGETLFLSGTGGDLGALYSASGTNTWSGVVNLDSTDAAFGAAAGQTLIVAGAVQNGVAGSSINIASGSQGVVQFTGPNTYTGGTTVSGGVASIASPTQLGNPSGAALITFVGNGTIHASATFSTSKEFVASGTSRSITFDIATGQTLTANGAIRSTGGAGVVTKTGGGTLVLGASNTQLDNDIAVVQGTLDIRHAGALGDVAASDYVIASGGSTTRLSFNSSTAVTGSFQTQSSGANIVIDRLAPGAAVTHSLANLAIGAHTLNVSPGSNFTSGTAGLAFTGVTTLSGNATINSDVQLSLASVTGAGRNLTITGTGDTTITGVISTTTGSLTKQGGGTLILQGTSSYTGVTNVQQGTLSLQGGSIAGSSLTTIDSGATLTGSGTTGTLTIASGGTHRPGTGVGAATVSGNYNVGGQLAVEFASALGTAGVDHDLVDVSGGVTLNASTSSLAPNYTGAAGTFNPTFAQVFTIIRNDATDAVSGNFAGLPAGSNVMVDNQQLKIYYDQGTGNDVVLVSNVGVAPQLFVNDQWTAAATVDGDQQTGSAETAFVGVNAFSSTPTAFAAQPSFSGPLRLNAGSYSSIDLTSSGPGSPANVTLQLVRDANAPTTETDVAIGQLVGNSSDQIATQFHAGTGGNLVVASGAFGGMITGGGSVTKTSTGTLTLSGANNYTGTTFVNAGTLIVNNTTTGQGDYLIASGARLGGFGTLGLAAGKSVTVSPFPGELSPGATSTPYAPPTPPSGYAGHALDATYSAGIDPLTVGALSIVGDVNLGGHLLVDVVAHDLHDVLNVSGTLTIGPTATLEINGTTDFTQLDFVGDFGLVTNDRVHLIRAATIVGNFSNAAANQSFLDAAGRSILFGADADGLFLMAASPIQAVPEPTAIFVWLLLFAIAVCVYKRSIRSRQRAVNQ